MTLREAIESFDELRSGSSGNLVKLLQAMLCSYSVQMEGEVREGGGIDGVFGGHTKNAVVMFQKDVYIKQDGIVGDDTWRNLAMKVQDTGITNSESGRWYQLTSPYAFSVKYVNSPTGTVTSSSVWYYFNPFSSETLYKKFKELGSLI